MKILKWCVSFSVFIIFIFFQIDLDTIDYSNLNRQFLFSRADVDHSKAETAVAAISRLHPSCRLVAHHANVFAPQFDAEYFKRFDIVMNALDNLAARRQVNRMCMLADVPLIESGTAGYLGQVWRECESTSMCGLSFSPVIVSSCHRLLSPFFSSSFPLVSLTSARSKSTSVA